MLPIPKPKFFERKVPAGQSEDDYFDDITARQTHILRDAIDRVSSIIFFYYKKNLKSLFIPPPWIQLVF